MAIFNRYKDIFEDFINRLNIKPPNMLRPVEKGLCNVMPSFKNPLIELNWTKTF